jgi:predicted branched-subunit amino acid permease
VSDAAERSAIRNSLGVGIAVGAYGFAFGAASVVAGGGSLAAALGSGLLLASRNTLYAMRLSPLLQVRGARRLLAALGTIDESTAMAIAQRQPALSRVAFWWTFAGVFTFWNLSTLLGAAGASAFGDPKNYGLDAVIPAAFLALLAPRLRSGAVERRVAVGGAVIALVLIPLTPPGVPVLAACAALLLSTTVPGRQS